MKILFETVDGGAFADEAGRILNNVWAKPSMDYSTPYVEWQLRFPSAVAPPAVGAFEGRNLVGFAAATARRFRVGGQEANGFITSFWCIRPGFGGPAGAILLIERLLRSLRDIEAPILTFGVNGGRGEMLFPQSCRRMGFLEVDLGILPACSALVSGKPDTSSWDVQPSEAGAILPGLTSQVSAQQPGLLSVAADPQQLQHYLADPRQRQLLVATNRETGRQAAAWAIQSVTRTPAGPQIVPTLDSFIGTCESASALPALLAAVAGLMPSAASPVVVNAPSLGFLDAGSFRSLGIRRVGKGFHARLYLPPSLERFRSASSTSVEIV